MVNNRKTQIRSPEERTGPYSPEYLMKTLSITTSSLYSEARTGPNCNGRTLFSQRLLSLLIQQLHMVTYFSHLQKCPVLIQFLLILYENGIALLWNIRLKNKANAGITPWASPLQQCNILGANIVVSLSVHLFQPWEMDLLVSVTRQQYCCKMRSKHNFLKGGSR